MKEVVLNKATSFFLYLFKPFLRANMKHFLLLSVILPSLFFHSSEKIHIRDDFKPYFDEYGVEGSFLLYDMQSQETTAYNYERCKEAFLPASSFKILNSLIGLETGVVPDENFIIPWDSVIRQVPAWNRDHTMASAFRNSVVPWYQELARRIGLARMKEWVAKSDYGKMDINQENLDRFWLVGNSRISPLEQMDFLKRLVKNQLPFSAHSIETVKKIMILEQNEKGIFRGKTGWAHVDGNNIGWFVGYLEKGSNTYIFVLNVESDNEDTTLFSKSREGITRKILHKLNLFP